jgi:hypothetical protein
MFRDIPHEYDDWSPKSDDGNAIGYRHVLVDWLNLASSGSVRAREMAERVGAFIRDLNDSRARFSEREKRWIPRKPGAIFDGFKSLKEHAPYYKFETNLYPAPDGVKWELVINCVETPSGPRGGNGAWEGGSAERDAVDAIIHIAIDGQLGTIRRCAACDRWFLTKDDPRIYLCPDHDVEDFRRGSAERILQARTAAQAARDRERNEDRKYWERRLSKASFRPGPHRAEK